MHNVLHRLLATCLLAVLSVGCSGNDGGTGNTTADPPGSAVCQELAAWQIGCGEAPGQGKAELVDDCERNREYVYGVHGPTCGPLFDTLLACDADNACEAGDACQAAQDAHDDCMPEPGDVCERYAANVLGCAEASDATIAEIAGDCQVQINAGAYEDPACGAATEVLHACFADASCDAIADQTACEPEVADQQAMCPFWGE